MSAAADKRQLRRVAAGEVGPGARSNITLDQLERRGLIKRWPGEPAELTDAGRAVLEDKK